MWGPGSSHLSECDQLDFMGDFVEKHHGKSAGTPRAVVTTIVQDNDKLGVNRGTQSHGAFEVSQATEEKVIDDVPIVKAVGSGCCLSGFTTGGSAFTNSNTQT